MLPSWFSPERPSQKGLPYIRFFHLSYLDLPFGQGCHTPLRLRVIALQRANGIPGGPSQLHRGVWDGSKELEEVLVSLFFFYEAASSDGVDRTRAPNIGEARGTTVGTSFRSE
jgi:hypothetical protein